MRVKVESEKAGLKLNIQKTKMMASGPITWQIGGKVEAVTDFLSLGSKITADGDCSHKIKTLVPWKRSYDQPRQHTKKQRHHFANKGPYSQSYNFSSSGSDSKASTYNAGELGSIPGLGRSPGEENGNPLQYSCLENPTDREAW